MYVICLRTLADFDCRKDVEVVPMITGTQGSKSEEGEGWKAEEGEVGGGEREGILIYFLKSKKKKLLEKSNFSGKRLKWKKLTNINFQLRGVFNVS